MRKEYFALIACALTLLLILGAEVGPFIVTGVPALLIRDTSPSRGISPGSSASWTDSWQRTVERYEGFALGSWAEGDITLSVKRKIDIEVTPILWVIQDKPINALFNTTADKLEGYNLTMYPNRYSFGIRYSLHYDVNVLYTEKSSGKVNPFAPSIQSRREDVVEHALDYLINEYNEDSYLSDMDVYFSIDAPTLGADQSYALNPDYIGVLDMYFMSLAYDEPVKGWAGAFIPKDPTTPLDLYGSIGDIKKGATPLWHAETPTLLTPTELKWFEDLAPAIAYFKTSILTFGTKLVVDTSRAFPQYWNLQFEREGGSDPRATQWFRVDLGFKTSEIYDVSGIEVPESVREDVIRIVIPTVPAPYPYPTPPDPPLIPWLTLLTPIVTLLIVFIVAIMVIIVVYIIVKAKYGWKKYA